MFLDRSRTRASGRRLIALALPAALLVLAGCTSAAGTNTSLPKAPPASTTTGTQEIGAPVDQAGVAIPPVPGSGVPGSTIGSGGSGSASSGIMTYPFPGYVGSAGVAPDHTIVVVGSGDAPFKSDGTDRAAAEKLAVAAALVDARALADSAAHAAGVSITGVNSISVSVGEGYGGVMPMAGSTEPNIAPSAPGGPGAPAVPVASPPAPVLSVTVTVAYRID